MTLSVNERKSQNPYKGPYIPMWSESLWQEDSHEALWSFFLKSSLCVIPSLWVLVGAVTGFQPIEYSKGARRHSCNYIYGTLCNTPSACRLSLALLLALNKQAATLWTACGVGHLVGLKLRVGTTETQEETLTALSLTAAREWIPTTGASLNVDPSLAEPTDENTAQVTPCLQPCETWAEDPVRPSMDSRPKETVS